MKGKSSWTEESKKKYIQTGIEQGRFWKPDDPEYVEFKKYRRKVYYWTSKNNLNVLENSDKRGRGRYHLDHKYSIAEGFTIFFFIKSEHFTVAKLKMVL